MIQRACRQLIDEYLEFFPCVALVGARQSGKTTLVKALNGTWNYFDLEKRDDYKLISDSPDLFLRLNSKRVVIDEAQLLPELFPALRVSIDNNRETSGQFVITGSSSPELLKSISESLAGRIGIIEISPLTMGETSASPSPFYRIFQNPDNFRDIINNLTEQNSLTNIHHYWFQGGYPEPWSKNSERFTELWMEQYVQTYVERDIARLFPGMNPARFMQFTEMLAGLSGQVINYSEVARALGVSQPVIRDYFNIVHGTFLWRQILPYEKNVKKRIVKHPKGHLRDSGILHHLLRLRDLRQLQSHPSMGFSWEAMTIEELLRGLCSAGISHDYYYYRTASGAEIDLILEGKFGLIPIEIKYNKSVALSKIRGIKDFVKEHALPFGIVIDNGESVRWITEEIVAIPFSFCI